MADKLYGIEVAKLAVKLFDENEYWEWGLDKASSWMSIPGSQKEQWLRIAREAIVYLYKNKEGFLKFLEKEKKAERGIIS